jgi:hypothetical protein
MVLKAIAQHCPFESDDESECWIDITPPASPLQIKDDNMEEPAFSELSEATDPSSPSNTQKVRNLDSLFQTRIIEWKRNIVNTNLAKTLKDHEPDANDASNRITENCAKETASEKIQMEFSELKLSHEETLKKLKQTQKQLSKCQQDHEAAMKDIKVELLATQSHRDDIEKKLWKKEEALVRAKNEVETLKKVINQNTSMVAMQRDHAISAIAEKDRLMQNYKDKIAKLKKELQKAKQHEEENATSFQKELSLLQESLASIQTPNVTPTSKEENESPLKVETGVCEDSSLTVDEHEDTENCSPNKDNSLLSKTVPTLDMTPFSDVFQVKPVGGEEQSSTNAFPTKDSMLNNVI